MNQSLGRSGLYRSWGSLVAKLDREIKSRFSIPPPGHSLGQSRGSDITTRENRGQGLRWWPATQGMVAHRGAECHNWEHSKAENGKQTHTCPTRLKEGIWKHLKGKARHGWRLTDFYFLSLRIGLCQKKICFMKRTREAEVLCIEVILFLMSLKLARTLLIKSNWEEDQCKCKSDSFLEYF